MTTINRPVKALLFDAGGVLLTIDFDVLSKELSKLATISSLSKEHYEALPESSHFEKGEQLARPLLDALLQRASSEVTSTRLQFLIYIWDIAWKLSAPHKNPPATNSKLFKTWAHVIEAKHQAENLWQRMIPGTAKALEQIKARGLTMGVVSNADGRVEEILKKLGIAHYFSIIIDSHIEKVEKPNPEIFNRALKRLNLKAKETLYLGDFYSIDVIGARKAGLGAVLIDPVNAWDTDDVPKITSLGDYAGFLQELPKSTKPWPWKS